MNRGQVAMKVRQHKEQYPELYCRHCLWRLTSGPCPTHSDPVRIRGMWEKKHAESLRDTPPVTADPLRIARALYREKEGRTP